MNISIHPSIQLSYHIDCEMNGFILIFVFISVLFLISQIQYAEHFCIVLNN